MLPDADAELRLLAYTDLFAVVEKPVRMLSVPGKGPEKQRCVPSIVLEMLPWARGPMVVHRLDMDTSGLLVVALTPEAQRGLSRQFEQRTVRKLYVALLDGIVEHASEGTIDAPIRLDPDRRPYQLLDPVHGRPATTRWRTRSFEIDRTRVELEPLTGRTHQLRMHAALPRPSGIGHPILGDVLYGRADSAPRLMLHACELEFTHPGSHERLTFRSPPPF